MELGCRIPYSTLHLRIPKKKDEGKKCMVDMLTQRGWSLNIPISMLYLRGTDPPNSPQEVVAKILPVSWPHPLAPAEKLPSYQVLNMQAEYIQTGKYDKNFLYDTAQLFSFPSVATNSDNSSSIQLFDNMESIVSITVKIPTDFPNDLISKPVFLEFSGRVIMLNIEACLTLCILVIG